MNSVHLTGYLNFDTELRTTATGKSFLSNKISVKNTYKGQDGKYGYKNIRFSAFGKTAEFIDSYIKKGDKIAITGEIDISKDGKYLQSVIAREVELLYSKPTNEFGDDFTEIDDDDEPF